MTIAGRLFALIVLAASLVAAAPPADPTPAKDRKICREVEHQTGSHIRTQRRCRTAEEWEEADRAKSLPLSAQITEGQGDVGQATRPQ
jgi:hypothetical protein